MAGMRITPRGGYAADEAPDLAPRRAYAAVAGDQLTIATAPPGTHVLVLYGDGVWTTQATTVQALHDEAVFTHIAQVSDGWYYCTADHPGAMLIHAGPEGPIIGGVLQAALQVGGTAPLFY